MHLINPIRAALALTVFVGLLAARPPATLASTRSAAFCGETTLQSATIYNSGNGSVSGHVYLIKDTCSSTIFARTVDPWWFSYANACIQVDNSVLIQEGNNCPMTGWFPFGGTIDSPRVTAQSGHTYRAVGIQNWSNTAYTAYQTQ